MQLLLGKPHIGGDFAGAVQLDQPVGLLRAIGHDAAWPMVFEGPPHK